MKIKMIITIGDTTYAAETEAVEDMIWSSDVERREVTE